MKGDEGMRAANARLRDKINEVLKSTPSYETLLIAFPWNKVCTFGSEFRSSTACTSTCNSGRGP